MGLAASLFYSIIYVCNECRCLWHCIILLGTKEASKPISLIHFKGLNERSPWLAVMMLFIMAQHDRHSPFGWLSTRSGRCISMQSWSAAKSGLAIVAVLFSVIGAFYYLRVIRMMYFDPPERLSTDGAELVPIVAGFDVKLVFSLNALNGLLCLLWVFFPTSCWLYARLPLCNAAEAL